MTPMNASYCQLVVGWLKGHQDACLFIQDVFNVIHTVDDILDGDVEVPIREVVDRTTTALINLPRNTFYQTHFSLLNPLLQMALLNGEIATGLERSQEANGKQVAYILRSSYTDLITACALIIGGKDWALQVGQEVRLHAAREGYDQYCTNLSKEPQPTRIKGVI